MKNNKETHKKRQIISFKWLRQIESHDITAVVMKDFPPIIHISFSDNRNHDDFWKHFVSGAVAGAVSRTVTAPIDRMKTFRQVSKNHASSSQLLKNMIKEGGITSLWRGNLLNVLKNTPKQAVRFAVYNETKRQMLGDMSISLSINQRFVAGCIAGLISQAATYPLEMLKVRLNLRTTGRYNGIVDAILKIYQTEGIRSFGRGFVPSMMSIMPYSGLDLASYESMKVFWTTRQDRRLHPHEQFIIGSLSCGLAQVCTYPLLLVSVKMQADERDVKTLKKSMMGMLLKIWRKEGFPGLYKGMYLNLFKLIPAMGLTYVTYEQCSRLLGIKMT